MSVENHLWLCFFRGLNVFGRGTISMLDLERRCRTAVADSGLAVEFIDYFGPTGNVAVMANAVPVEDIRAVLVRAVPKPVALVQPAIVREVNEAFAAWPPPPDAPGFKWTPGVSLLCEGDPRIGEVVPSDLGMFKRMAKPTVVLYRKERVTERGTLHADRNGGWAAVSDLTGTVLGGMWTARSLDVVTSLLAQAHWKLRSAGGENARAT